MVSRDVTRVLKDCYADEPVTKSYLDELSEWCLSRRSDSPATLSTPRATWSWLSTVIPAASNRIGRLRHSQKPEVVRLKRAAD
jgi:hypothetical protein